jgi:O-antigen/teichoic acid export membrane protein
MSSRYGGKRFKRGLLFFTLGKVVSGISGFLAMVLVVRLLSVQEFAHYSVLVSLIEIFAAFSALGLSHVLLRFVPELYVKHYTYALKQLVLKTFLIRSAVLVLMVLLSYQFALPISRFFGMTNFTTAFQLYLIVVLLRTTLFFLSQILESTLHQNVTQLAFIMATVARLVGMLYLSYGETVSLQDVIWVEIVSDVLGLILMLYGILDVIFSNHGDHKSQRIDIGWLKINEAQIRHVAVTGYSQHIIGLPFGSNTNRLVGGYLFAVPMMASFGFAQSIYEYIKRYLPAQLLLGLVRPVVVARYSQSRNFNESEQIGSSMMLVNMLLIGAIVLVLLVSGKPLLSWVSHGKYHGDALTVLLALMAVLALETHRLILEMLVQTVQRYDILIGSNFALSISIIPAILCFPLIGAIAFPVANALVLFASNFWVRTKLREAGYQVRMRSRTALCILLILSITTLTGAGLIWLGTHWVMATLIAMLTYFYALWKSYAQEIAMLYSSLTHDANTHD